jgi:hypothetical protein
LHTASPFAKNGSKGSLRPTPSLRNVSIFDIPQTVTWNWMCYNAILSQVHKITKIAILITTAPHQCYKLKQITFLWNRSATYHHTSHVALQFLMFHNDCAQRFNVRRRHHNIRLLFINYDSTFKCPNCWCLG